MNLQELIRQITENKGFYPDDYIRRLIEDLERLPTGRRILVFKVEETKNVKKTLSLSKNRNAQILTAKIRRR